MRSPHQQSTLIGRMYRACGMLKAVRYQASGPERVNISLGGLSDTHEMVSLSRGGCEQRPAIARLYLIVRLLTANTWKKRLWQN